MKIQLKTFLFLLCLATTIFAQSGKIQLPADQFKHLAGGPDEIASMRLPAPESLGVSSKSALIPISLKNAGNIEIPIESAENFRLMLIAPDSRGWRINASLPGEYFANLREDVFPKGLTRTTSEYGFDGNQFPAEVFAFDSVQNGLLRIKIDFPDSDTNSAKTLGYLIVAADSPYLLRSALNTFETVANREIGFIASLNDKSENRLIGNIREARVKLEIPSGKTLELPMKDNGDGSFSQAFVPVAGGKFTAQIIARGATPEGNEFIRTTEHVFNVATTRVVIGANAIARRAKNDLRFQISLPVNNLKTNQKVIAYAEVWGENAAGDFEPVAWIGGMSRAKKRLGLNSVSLSLDARWLARAGEKENYELRNIRLQNSDSFAVVGTAETVSLPSLELPIDLQNFNNEITDEMRTGKRPELETPNAVGGKLLLVHGYCSGSNPWSPGQFADSVQFLDANQNRSHDQFAQLIRNFGAQYPSFGIVAHSQGGAAALHLYTYYWSGLDYATGARLIQSVGTPYQGTALAGNLALIGSIFGAGCGSNTDLTYSGAAAWLSNVPSWARAKVYYHTTSFTDLWWRYDYCNFASDLVLGDPDDGVVERAYAQLPGANNMGHKTGWCHTSGMRDPAQTSDSARNATMNAQAAR